MRLVLKSSLAASALALLGGCTAIVGPMTEANCDEVSNCYPYVCDSENVGCLSGCVADSDCASGATCDRQSGQCQVSYCEPVGALYSYEISEAAGNWTEVSAVYDGVADTLTGDQSGFLSWALGNPNDGVYFFRGIDYGSLVQVAPDFADAAETRRGIQLQGPNHRSLPYDLTTYLNPSDDDGRPRVMVSWVRRNASSRTDNDLVVASMSSMEVGTFLNTTPFLLGRLSAVLEDVGFVHMDGTLVAIWIRKWGEDDYVRAIELDGNGWVPEVTTVTEEEELDTTLYQAGTVYDIVPVSVGDEHFVAYRSAATGESLLQLAALERGGAGDLQLYTAEAQRLDSWGATLYGIDGAGGETLGGLAWINEVDAGWGVFSTPIGASGYLAEPRRVDAAFGHTAQIRDALVATASGLPDEYGVAFVGSRNNEYGIWMLRLGPDGEALTRAPVRLSAPGLGTPSHLEVFPAVDARTGNPGYGAVWLQPENASGEVDGLQHVFYTRVTCQTPD